jgi:hypothetical protein
MAYYEQEIGKKINTLPNEFFDNDPGGGVLHIKDKKTGEIKPLYGLQFVLQKRELNLWKEIRVDAIKYFEENEIEWHKDVKGEPQKGPEGHLLSSNIACVNHLFYLRQKKDLATKILNEIDKRIISAEIIDDGYIEFEMMDGKEKTNPLKEKSDNRKRGSKSTSIDAVMVGRKNDGKNVLFLIEWKYTEKGYDPECKYIARNNYHKNYIDILQEENCPINSPENVKGLFFEPYYQLMRQTLFGWKMIETSEYNCNEFICLHIIPHGNIEFKRNSKDWKCFLKEQYKQNYKVIAPDDLLKPILNEKNTSLFIEYLKKRYW